MMNHFCFLVVAIVLSGTRIHAQNPDSLALQLQLESVQFNQSNLDQETYQQLKEAELLESTTQLPQTELERLAGFTSETAPENLSNEQIFESLQQSLTNNILLEQLHISLEEGLAIEFTDQQGAIDGTSQTTIAFYDEVSPDVSQQELSFEPAPGETFITIATGELLLEPTEDDPSSFNRLMEIRDLNPLITWQKNMLINARSVGLVVEKNQIHRITDSLYQLDVAGKLGERFRLCPDESFTDQPVAGEGTAFIIGTTTMVTASHVLTQMPEKYAIVFGYELISKKGAYEVFIPANNVFFPKRIVSDQSEEDILVFEVDRPLPANPLPISTRKSIPDKGLVYMIGHPLGLPKKVALNATVNENTNTSFFYTSLDAFQGNSGSPVFLFGTNEVVGILVSGQKDYEWDGQCNQTVPCSPPNCRGEKVMRSYLLFHE